eukprot:TRINITY_DN94444_c0_g1_i1.p1 TRINITY_DN94444_c0_g1~~TRINITY_DN94444_c0_g1_i1.p1  ORF type:complete len:167 (-),score=19.02 TRINITY_DN94444_c0_g1_i1:234-734(-)
MSEEEKPTMKRQPSYKTLKQKHGMSIEVPEAPLRMHADLLAELMKKKEAPVIIDVRGEDYAGGSIPGAIKVPWDELESGVDELAAQHKGADKVVFLCMNSQVRAPSCAAAFMAKAKELDSDAEVFILIGGFAGWVRANSRDEELVQDFDEKLWNSIWEATGLPAVP